MIEIKYPGGSVPELTYRGRNRYGKQTGIAIVNRSGEGQEVMRLSPITARGRLTDACHMEVPVEAASALVNAIQSFLSGGANAPSSAD